MAITRDVRLDVGDAAFDIKGGIITTGMGTNSITLIRVPRGFVVNFNRHKEGGMTVTFPGKLRISYQEDEFPQMTNQLMTWFRVGSKGAS